MWGNHQWLVNSPHKGPVTREMFPCDDVIMTHIHKYYVPWIMYTIALVLMKQPRTFIGKCITWSICEIQDSKVHRAYMGPTWGQQDPGGPHIGPMNLAIRVIYLPKSQVEINRVFKGGYSVFNANWRIHAHIKIRVCWKTMHVNIPVFAHSYTSVRSILHGQTHSIYSGWGAYRWVGTRKT